MPNALTRRLEEYAPLTDDDRSKLAVMTGQPTRTISARRDLIRQGDQPQNVYLILRGWACHYRSLPDGRRQICDFAIPGDLCDLNVFILDRMDHSIGAITEIVVAEISREALQDIVTTSPNITTALWWQELVSKSIHREWILNIGQRTAIERIAHLFCEMFLRLETIGITEGYSCYFPPTQVDISEATGITTVHVNRTLQELRARGLITLQGKRLTIPDMRALQGVGTFNPEYLHHRRLDRHTDRERSAFGLSVPQVA